MSVVVHVLDALFHNRRFNVDWDFFVRITSYVNNSESNNACVTLDDA